MMKNKSVLIFNIRIFIPILYLLFSQYLIAATITGIDGFVIQADSQKPIQYATITLINVDNDKIEMGQLTDENGCFSLRNIPDGEYILETDFIGFITFESEPFFYNKDISYINYDNISLQLKALEINPVNVKAENPFYEVKVDKKVYNIDQMKSTAGGTCCDVMKKVPSLDIGPNGEISLRGSDNVTVLINEKRTGIIGGDRKTCAVAVPVPAAMIDRIEIITSPSAEYDPDGMSGIVNIILKEEKVFGYNGELSINMGDTDKLNGGGALSYRKNKIHLFTKLNFESQKFVGIGSRFADGSVIENNNNISSNDIQFFNIGSKYDISSWMLFTGEGKFTQVSSELNETTTFSNNSDIISINNNEGQSQVYDLGLYSNLSNDNILNAEISFDIQENETQNSHNEYQLDISRLIVKSDYYNSGNDNFQFNLGYKGRINTHVKEDAIDDNVFKFNEDIHAIYGSLTYEITENIKSKAGLRFETVESLIDFTNNNYYKLYPSAHLSYVINPFSSIRFGYSSRVNRPELKQLDPFLITSSTSIDTVGNPELEPEFIEAVELGYSRTSDVSKIDFTLYNHFITNITQWDESAIDTLTYRNAGNGNLNGGEMMLKYSPLTMWDITLTGNYYQSNISRDNEIYYGGLGRLISTYKFVNNGEFELSGTYHAPSKTSIGLEYPDGQYTIDLAYQVSLFDDRLKLTCKVIDIFDNNQYVRESDNYTVYKKYDERTFYITMQYKFSSI